MPPIIEIKSELEGIIKLEVIREDGTLKEAAGLNVPFKNLITNAGLDYVAGNSAINNCINYCRVGTGSTPPAVTDTTLAAKTGTASPQGSQTNSVQTTTLPYYSQHVRVYTFGVGAVSGNLTEIGFFSSASTGTMWSRALIKDSGGNPTTLTLLATEQLKVTYTVIRYLPATVTGSFTLNTNGVNSTINYTLTPANISSSGPWYESRTSATTMYIGCYETDVLGAVTSRPSGAVSPSSTASASTYISGTYQQTFAPTFAISDANFTTGIGSIIFWVGSTYGSNYAGYQCSFSPKIMKTASQTLTIGIKLSWGRTTAQ